MIGSLRGVLLARSHHEVLIEVAGVGHRVHVSPTTSVSLGEIGDEVFVWVHHHIREDVQALYGFASADGRECFSALLGAHGVGPSLALGILSVHGPNELVRVLADDDVAALCLVPGVGKKTAARLLVELKSRLDLDLGQVVVDVGPAGDGSATSGGSVRADVREALTGLGYGPEEIRDVLAELARTEGADTGGTSELLRQALARLAVSR